MSESTEGPWDVGIIWLTRRLQRPDRMLRRRFSIARRKQDKDTSDGSRTALDAVPDGCGGFDDIGSFLLVLVVIALFILFIALGPGLLAITVGVAEIILVLLGAVAAVAGRVLFGQPWEIVARRGDEQIEWRVSGVRRARDMAGRIEQQLAGGADPDMIEPNNRDRTPPDLSDVPNMYHRAEFRLVGRFFGALIAFAIVVGIAIVAVT